MMRQRKSVEQIQDMLQIIDRYSFTSTSGKGDPLAIFSEIIRHLTTEEQVQFHQLINKLTADIP